MDLVTMATATGLAAGAGSRAGIAALGLAVFHYTDYFELAPQFDWLASPAVMAVLGVLALLCCAGVWRLPHSPA